MSTIGVKYHDEDIHNIIRKPSSPPIKSPRYKSQRKVIHIDDTKKFNGHQTFGLAHYEPPESKNFLRKGRPRVTPASIKQMKKDPKVTGEKKFMLPKYNFEKPMKINKNYVKENIKKADELQPKVPVPRIVVTPKGTVKDLAHLLQMIKIRQSQEYGRIPDYLCKRRQQWERERRTREAEEQVIREYKEKMAATRGEGMNENVYMVDEETRQELLKGLKENWNELSKQFLKLPVMIDTIPKMKRKEWLEREMDQLEKDLRLVESHPFIYLERHDRPCQSKATSKSDREEEKKEETKEEEEEKKEGEEEAQKEDGEKQEGTQTGPPETPPRGVSELRIVESTPNGKNDESKITNY